MSNITETDPSQSSSSPPASTDTPALGSNPHPYAAPKTAGGGNPLFVNPYEGVEKSGNWKRINVMVNADDHVILRRIRIEQGTIQTCVNILYKKLIDELKKRNIQDFTKAKEFEDFVVRSQLMLPEESAPVNQKGSKTKGK